MKSNNKFSLTVTSNSYNESFVRVAVSSFIAQLDPTIDELCDIKTAVSEAVTNSIVHAYKNYIGKIYITTELYEDRSVVIKIRDRGCGIDNVDEALTPFFTTLSGEERSGLGFTIMQTFMDEFSLQSEKGKGSEFSFIIPFCANSCPSGKRVFASSRCWIPTMPLWNSARFCN